MAGCTPATGCVPRSGGGLVDGWSGQYHPGRGIAEVCLAQRSTRASALVLHKGGRLGLPWLLLADPPAMVVLGLGGLPLVWRRPHGNRRVPTMTSIFALRALWAVMASSWAHGDACSVVVEAHQQYLAFTVQAGAAAE